MHKIDKIPVIVRIEAQLDERYCSMAEALELGRDGVAEMVKEDLLGFLEFAGIEVIFIKGECNG